MSSRRCPLLFLIIVVMVGCMRSPSQIPILPPDSRDPALEGTNPSVHSANHYLWGYYLFYVNPESNGIEVVPVREVADHWNVLKWLEQGPCTNCVSIVGFTANPSGTKNVDVKITHPFSSLNLTGFDVRGIAIFNGSHTFPKAGLTTPDKSEGDGELVNADGYTTLYNSTTAGSGPSGLQGYIKGNFATEPPPGATLNGYKCYNTDYSSNTRNAFYAGDEITVTYEIMMPTTAFVFGYAVDASWVPPTNKPVTNPMYDFPPSANCPEPWKIETELNPVGPGLNDHGGEASLWVNVYDYQGIDSHGHPKLECPELFDGIKTMGCVTAGSKFSRYHALIPNEKVAPVGDYKCLIKVVDSENANSPWYLDLTAYQLVTLTVAPWVSKPPVADADIHPIWQLPGGPIEFVDRGSYDPDGGAIVKYEWDWDNDAIFDEEGASASHTWDSVGTYYVQFRVTDDEGDTGVLDSPLEIQIFAECGPGGFLWAKSAGGSSDEHPYGVTSLPDGSAVITGSFRDWASVTFGKGEPNEVTLTSAGRLDIFIARYNPDGAFAWATRAGGEYQDEGYGITSIADGSVLVTGSFTGPATFGQGEPNEVTLSPGGAFIAQYNPDGTVAWARGIGSNDGGGRSYGVSSFPDGSFVLTGQFRQSVTFGEGEPNETTLVSPGDTRSIFVARYNPDGTLAWAKSALSEGLSSRGHAVTFLSDYSVAVTGWFTGDTVFGEGEPNETMLYGDQQGLSDIFIARYNPDGTLAWSKGVGDYMCDYGLGIASLSDDSIVVTGFFETSATFGLGDPNETHVDSVGREDMYVARFNPDGTLAWVKTAGDENRSTYAWAIAALSDDSVVVTGEFSLAVFGRGEPNEITLYGDAWGLMDIWIARFGPDGMLAWAKDAGSTGCYDSGSAVTALSDDSIAVAGYISGLATFGEGEPNETSVGPSGYNEDIFVARFCK